MSDERFTSFDVFDIVLSQLSIMRAKIMDLGQIEYSWINLFLLSRQILGRFPHCKQLIMPFQLESWFFLVEDTNIHTSSAAASSTSMTKDDYC